LPPARPLLAVPPHPHQQGQADRALRIEKLRTEPVLHHVPRDSNLRPVRLPHVGLPSTSVRNADKRRSHQLSKQLARLDLEQLRRQGRPLVAVRQNRNVISVEPTVVLSEYRQQHRYESRLLRGVLSGDLQRRQPPADPGQLQSSPRHFELHQRAIPERAQLVHLDVLRKSVCFREGHAPRRLERGGSRRAKNPSRQQMGRVFETGRVVLLQAGLHRGPQIRRHPDKLVPKRQQIQTESALLRPRQDFAGGDPVFEQPPRQGPAGIMTLLNNILVEATKYNLDYQAALIHLHIANVQFSLGLTSQALRVLDRCLVQILAHGGNYDRARAVLLYVKCQIAHSQSLDPAERQPQLVKAAEMLERAKEDFRVVEAYSRMKDVLYLQVGSR
jgi:hypothetical protein